MQSPAVSMHQVVYMGATHVGHRWPTLLQVESKVVKRFTTTSNQSNSESIKPFTRQLLTMLQYEQSTKASEAFEPMILDGY